MGFALLLGMETKHTTNREGKMVNVLTIRDVEKRDAGNETAYRICPTCHTKVHWLRMSANAQGVTVCDECGKKSRRRGY